MTSRPIVPVLVVLIILMSSITIWLQFESAAYQTPSLEGKRDCGGRVNHDVKPNTLDLNQLIVVVAEVTEIAESYCYSAIIVVHLCQGEIDIECIKEKVIGHSEKRRS